MKHSIATVAIVLALALVVAACGGGNDDTSESTPTSTNLFAQRCPLTVVVGEAGIETYGDPVPGAWDTTEIIGLPLGEAQSIAEENGCTVEVSIQDGTGIPIQLGLFPERVLVWTEDDTVTTIEQVG